MQGLFSDVDVEVQCRICCFPGVCGQVGFVDCVSGLGYASAGLSPLRSRVSRDSRGWDLACSASICVLIGDDRGFALV